MLDIHLVDDKQEVHHNVGSEAEAFGLVENCLQICARHEMPIEAHLYDVSHEPKVIIIWLLDSYSDPRKWVKFVRAEEKA
jgi:hypothetical protein